MAAPDWSVGGDSIIHIQCDEMFYRNVCFAFNG